MSRKRERERERKRKNAIYSGHLRLCQQPRAAHALRSDQKYWIPYSVPAISMLLEAFGASLTQVKNPRLQASILSAMVLQCKLFITVRF